MAEEEIESNREAAAGAGKNAVDPRAPARGSLFRGGLLSAFGTRDFKLFRPGALVSNTGTWIQNAALM